MKEDRAARWLVPLAYLALAIALTWPMAQTFTTRLGGDFGDGFQNLWNFWWVKECFLHLKNPFFTDHLRHPFGVSLVFQTTVLPDAVVALPLWLFLPALGVYNSGILWSFTLCGLGMYALVHDLTQNRWASLFSGAAFMAMPFHMAHALGHQHLVSLGYLPLYLMFLHRLVRGGTRRDAILGGLCLAAAALCSWYQLLFAAFWSLGVFAWAAIAQREALFSKVFLKNALTLAAAFLVITGPLLVSMFIAARAEAIVGSHDPRFFAADLQSFFYPNARSIWATGSEPWARMWARWSGNSAENGDYLGYSILLLAVIGAVHSGLARAYLATATFGAILSLGPTLHVGGQYNRNGSELPLAWLSQALPLLNFSGVPVRFGLMAQGGLIIAAGIGLGWVLSKLSALQQIPASLAVGAVMLTEFWPQPLPTSVWPVPEPMAEWARSPDNFAVLDLLGDTRMLWDAIHHGKPCVGGYVTRAPKRLDDWWDQHPIFSKLSNRAGTPVLKLEREDPAIDFNWGAGSPDPRIDADFFQAQWQGEIQVPADGTYMFYLAVDDGAVMALDNRIVVNAQGNFSPVWHTGTAQLTAGRHTLQMRYQELTGGASVRLEWEGPGIPREVVRPAPHPDGSPGSFSGRYFNTGLDLGMTREQGQQMLRDIQLRYVVLGDHPGQDPLWEGALGLPTIWRGDGMRIYEVPPGPATASP